MIIFGHRAYTFGAGRGGEFHCPQCNTQRPYKLKKLQRFFHLYFIPIIPLTELQRWVECRLCKSKYRTEVLKLKAEQEARQKLLDDGYRAVLAHFGKMSGRSDEAFVERLERCFTDLTGRLLTPEQLRKDLAGGPGDISYTASELRGFLTEQGREIAVRGAVIAATADGTLTDAKKAAVADFARILGMSDAHLLGVMASAAPGALPGSAPAQALPAPRSLN
jgi:hypothetical protein